MFGNAHQAVVKQDGIVGLAKRAYFTRLVDAVPLFYIVQNVFEGSFLSFRFQLIVAAAGTDFGRCRDEDFQFGIGEDGSSYVTSVHDNAFFLTHGLLLSDQCLADKSQGGNRAYVRRNFQTADAVFHADIVQIRLRSLAVGVEAERNVYVVHLIL